jgi:hypothetical protein
MKLTDLLKDVELGKVYTDRDKPPFKTPTQVNESKMAIGKGQYANIYDMKKEMKEGKFDPSNPTVAVTGLGVYNLKLLEKVITRDLTSRLKDLGGELAAKNLNILLFSKYATLGSKIQGLWEVYQQMNTSQYKRAVTMYKKKR